MNVLPKLAIRAFLPLLCASGAALADNNALIKCRTVADMPARVACYDAIPLDASTGTPKVVVAAPAPARTAEQSFGMEQVRKPEPQTNAIESTIPGSFSGWGPNSQIRLANGQVWRVADGSAADLMPVNDPKVKIVRNVIGTMFLEIDGTNNSPKVRRLQ
jgi:hypothetical protein